MKNDHLYLYLEDVLKEIQEGILVISDNDLESLKNLFNKLQIIYTIQHSEYLINDLRIKIISEKADELGKYLCSKINSLIIENKKLKIKELENKINNKLRFIPNLKIKISTKSDEEEINDPNWAVNYILGDHWTAEIFYQDKHIGDEGFYEQEDIDEIMCSILPQISHKIIETLD